MRKISFAFIISLFLAIVTASAQISKNITKIATITAPSGWIQFHEDKNINPSNVFNVYKGEFGLTNNEQMIAVRTESDKLGFTHQRYQQYCQNIPIEGAEFIIHSKNGKAVSGNGNIIYGINTVSTPSLSPQDAINKAISFTNAETYMWESQENEALIKRAKKDPQATYYPKAQLVYIDKNFSKDASKYILAYKVNIYASQPLSHKYVYVDALNGNIYHTLERIHVTDVPAVAHTKFSGVQNITVDSTGPGAYRLRETSRSGVETYDLNTGTNYGAAVDFTHPDTDWDLTNTELDEVALDAHFGAEQTYDYYQNMHGRNSYDDNGSILLSYVHYDEDYANAFWDGTRMTYGDGDGTSQGPFTALDVCAHELTHGVTEYTANLVYQNEPGALNEAFSDIFSAAVEFYATPALADWFVGEDFDLSGGNGFRNMSDPNEDDQPDTYHGTHWYSGTMDNGGVHLNNSIGNFWFYLLTEGGSGINDFGNAYNVHGIGFGKSDSIAYRALSVYLTSTSEFYDARLATIQAAIDIFGNCSEEMMQTANAWYAVGLGMMVADNDLYANRVTQPVTACGMTNETVSVRTIYNGCMLPLLANDTVFFGYQADGGVLVNDTLILTADLNGGDTLNFTFSEQADVHVIGTHHIKCWVSYKNDTISMNDTIQDYSFINKIYQNSDVGVTGILEPASKCFMSNDEDLTIQVSFFGCEFLGAGNEIPVAYTVDNGVTWVNDTITTTYDFFPDSVIYHTFSTPVDLSEPNIYTIRAKTNFEIDSMNNNDLYSMANIKNPFALADTMITFEEANTIRNFLVTLGSQAHAGVASAASNPNSGTKGFRMTGGNAMEYYTLLEFPDGGNNWEINEFLSAKITFCVDATAWSHAYLNFDLKQTFGKTAYEMFLGDGMDFSMASNFRVLVNDSIQIGGTYNPTSASTDPFVTYWINMDSYAGTQFTVTFESRNISKDTLLFVMDNAYLDNVGFHQLSYEGFQDISLDNYINVYPNPVSEQVHIDLFSNTEQQIAIALFDIQGKLVSMKNENAINGQNLYKMNLKELPDGLYFIRVTAGTGIYNSKVIKQ
ncbi:MAG: M4 family metallopeptidase [Bacteroidales bacterium]|jgi:Zn-dependent metalloprotease|nr:M4 family metallopeptidase [Bacteroidales bacterium]MDD4215040.1 M4 family metallopeptidase [Bacteroidales bacterium]